MTQRLRKLLFWTHLTAGVVAGVVILVMSVTGTLLTFQQSVLRIIERDRSASWCRRPARRGWTPMRCWQRVRAWAARRAADDADVRVRSGGRAAVALGTQGMVFVNPYTGDVLGTGSARARAFYRSVTSWHRYLAVEGERRATARAITGACNAAFLVLAVTGLYLWWPRQWTWRHVAAVTIFRRGLRGKARDFNWHNMIGFWSAPVLIVLTATGMVISYAWASNLVYTLTGSPRPAAAAGRGGGAGGGATGAANQGGRVDRGDEQRETRTVPLATLVARAERELPTWRTMIIRLPARSGGPVSFSMSDREHWNSFARSTLTLDGAPAPTSAGSRTRRRAAARSCAVGCASRIPASSAA